MSTYGNIELYGVILTNDLDPANVSSNAVLTEAQISTLIYRAEDGVISGAPVGYQNLSTIVVDLEADDVDVSNQLSTNLSKISVSTASTELFLSQEANSNLVTYSAEGVSISNTISTNKLHDYTNDVDVSNELSVDFSRATVHDNLISNELSTHLSSNTAVDETLSNETSSVMKVQTLVNSSVSESLSAGMSTYLDVSAEQSNDMSTEYFRANSMEDYLSQTLSTTIVAGNNYSTELSGIFIDNSVEENTSYTSISNDLVTESSRAIVDSTNLSSNAELYSSENIVYYEHLDSNIVVVSNEVVYKLSTNLAEYGSISTSISTELITENSNNTIMSETHSSNMELLSNNVSTHEQFISDTVVLKADASNPVMTGSLHIMNETNELKIGQRWSLKATTDASGNSMLAFYYTDNNSNTFRAIPFMNKKVTSFNAMDSAGSVVNYLATGGDPTVTYGQSSYVRYVDPVTDAVVTSINVFDITTVDLVNTQLTLTSSGSTPVRPGKYAILNDSGNVQSYFTISFLQA